jgi:hypothetical protein
VGGTNYQSLPRKVQESFDDFEIEYDVIEEATDEELKDCFRRLQEGVSLNSSEKLNAIHSNLRDFCRTCAGLPFFVETVGVPNTRYAHFDIMAKVATIEIEGLNAGLRLEDVKQVFLAQSNFSSISAVAKRIRAALDFLKETCKDTGGSLHRHVDVASANADIACASRAVCSRSDIYNVGCSRELVSGTTAAFCSGSSIWLPRSIARSAGDGRI